MSEEPSFSFPYFQESLSLNQEAFQMLLNESDVNPCIDAENQTVEENISNLVEAGISAMKIDPENQEDYLADNFEAQNQMLCSNYASSSASRNWPGMYNFKVSFSPQEKVTLSVPWTFSEMKEKLYVKKDVACPINFSTNRALPNDVVIRAKAQYRAPDHAFEAVHRCPTHSSQDLQKGIVEAEHLIRCESKKAYYHVDPLTQHHSVIVPFEKSPGQLYSAYIYKFTCLSSCVGGPNRRALVVDFSLERNNEVIGQCSFDLKICASPGRDRRTDECSFEMKEQSLKKRKEPTLSRSMASPSPKKIKSEENGYYPVIARDLECYDFLKQMKKLYMMCRAIKHLPPSFKRNITQMYENKNEEKQI